ncbi:uncharacterized protein MYCFIDRAFT_179645 [Pseudocercospora fijiensis CIRAD86]|uniref:Uncharacterized protein n=1 Tax=Pseudocercospora fijiensis (strain CIRAD86) TaxID=383855 RepID=M2ZGG4_PSEFD|nr:uncharacterized protein MYCFIDRAFT_179645 [Pseudocercospora fijiensis CIRAD86]EME78209.1 hypothetical protein MYCFIDRAFT_179645 [Pseudocercospora fijiensis CIRAD86]
MRESSISSESHLEVHLTLTFQVQLPLGYVIPVGRLSPSIPIYSEIGGALDSYRLLDPKFCSVSSLSDANTSLLLVKFSFIAVPTVASTSLSMTQAIPGNFGALGSCSWFERNGRHWLAHQNCVPIKKRSLFLASYRLDLDGYSFRGWLNWSHAAHIVLRNGPAISQAPTSYDCNSRDHSGKGDNVVSHGYFALTAAIMALEFRRLAVDERPHPIRP